MLTLMLALACAKHDPPHSSVDVRADLDAQSETTELEALPSKPQGPELGVEQAQAPDSAVRAMLLAHDVQDLPTREVLDAHPDADQDLADLATSDPQLIVRERALLLLSLYPEPQVGVFCKMMLQDSEPKVRAAAARCLGGQELSASESYRSALETALADSDPRVGIAAAEVLTTVPESQAAMLAALELPDLPQETRARISELTTP